MTRYAPFGSPYWNVYSSSFAVGFSVIRQYDGRT